MKLPHVFAALFLAVLFAGLALFFLPDLLSNPSVQDTETVQQEEAVLLQHSGHDEDSEGRSKFNRPASAESQESGIRATRPSSSDHAALREEIRRADALEEERRVLNQGHLDMLQTRDLMEGDEFEAALDRLQQQAAQDSDAQELQELYADHLTRHFERLGNHFSLDGLACGLRLCMGQARAMNTEAAWHGQGGLGGDSRDGINPPMYAAVSHRVPDNDGTWLYRFFFTTDPESSGIALPPPEQMPGNRP